ncbi:hypothetical protein BKN38_02490 [Helicobacter sp. CLO-3]|uniref:hypothetical protein n=1 Tax=unclassified Helicobacter TaxID=2593540 RepID=UPI000804DFB4|nr:MULTISPECIES: hypothetical protein [unclassified Helicobacter]OBV29432.1 hypothetical protein BA723_00545 [Helicobacter sp. CLO-3]OHU84672.1 hypothetical protein BKN38_02490 [Helicobacter sp. CLO-3]
MRNVKQNLVRFISTNEPFIDTRIESIVNQIFENSVAIISSFVQGSRYNDERAILLGHALTKRDIRYFAITDTMKRKFYICYSHFNLLKSEIVPLAKYFCQQYFTLEKNIKGAIWREEEIHIYKIYGDIDLKQSCEMMYINDMGECVSSGFIKKASIAFVRLTPTRFINRVQKICAHLLGVSADEFVLESIDESEVLGRYYPQSSLEALFCSRDSSLDLEKLRDDETLYRYITLQDEQYGMGEKRILRDLFGYLQS